MAKNRIDRPMEYFATKLGHGRLLAPVGTVWWPRHSSSVSWYLLSRSLNDPSVETARQEITDCADQWDTSVMRIGKKGDRGTLMKEHCLLERAFVEAALAEETKMIGKIGSMLSENIRNQGLLYGTLLKDFPDQEFTGLLGQHVSLFVESVGWNMNADFGKAAECEKRRRANTVSLAALTAEWF